MGIEPGLKVRLRWSTPFFNVPCKLLSIALYSLNCTDWRGALPMPHQCGELRATAQREAAIGLFLELHAGHRERLHIRSVQRRFILLHVHAECAELQFHRRGGFGRNRHHRRGNLLVKQLAVADVHQEFRGETAGSLHSGQLFFFFAVFTAGQYGKRAHHREGEDTCREN